MLDRVLVRAPLVARRDQDETLTDVERLHGLEREASIDGRDAKSQLMLSGEGEEEDERDSPFAVNGQAAVALEAHLLVAATDVLAFALVAALVLLLAALVRDCEKGGVRSVAGLNSVRKDSGLTKDARHVPSNDRSLEQVLAFLEATRKGRDHRLFGEDVLGRSSVPADSCRQTQMKESALMVALEEIRRRSPATCSPSRILLSPRWAALTT